MYVQIDVQMILGRIKIANDVALFSAFINARWLQENHINAKVNTNKQIQDIKKKKRNKKHKIQKKIKMPHQKFNRFLTLLHPSLADWPALDCSMPLIGQKVQRDVG